MITREVVYRRTSFSEKLMSLFPWITFHFSWWASSWSSISIKGKSFPRDENTCTIDMLHKLILEISLHCFTFCLVFWVLWHTVWCSMPWSLQFLWGWPEACDSGWLKFNLNSIREPMNQAKTITRQWKWRNAAFWTQWAFVIGSSAKPELTPCS